MPDANVRINGSQPACADGRIDTRGLLHRGCSFARAAQTPLRAWHDCTGSALDLSRRGIRVPDRLHGVWDHRGRRQGSCAHRQPLEPPCTLRAAPSHLLFLPSSLPSRACLDHSPLGCCALFVVSHEHQLVKRETRRKVRPRPGPRRPGTLGHLKPAPAHLFGGCRNGLACFHAALPSAIAGRPDTSAASQRHEPGLGLAVSSHLVLPRGPAAPFCSCALSSCFGVLPFAVCAIPSLSTCGRGFLAEVWSAVQCPPLLVHCISFE